jgi:hypothetical protein
MTAVTARSGADADGRHGDQGTGPEARRQGLGAWWSRRPTAQEAAGDAADRMPAVRYQADLVEAVVWRELARRQQAGEDDWPARYRKAADRLYVLFPDPRPRAAAFQRLHAEFFEALGCGRPVRDALQRARLPCAVVLVARARTPDEEEADVSADRSTLGLRIMAERFGTPALERLLDHELGHVADILDPAFAYGQLVGTPVVRGAVGTRFGVLWDCVVDGRTARSGRQPLRTPDDHERAVRDLFPMFSPDGARAVVARLWHGPRPPYEALVRFAGDPRALATWCGVAPAAAAAPLPGAPCPLCRFPTYAWADVPAQIAAQIAAEFPDWTPAAGACERCVERYLVMMDLGAIVNLGGAG